MLFFHWIVTPAAIDRESIASDSLPPVETISSTSLNEKKLPVSAPLGSLRAYALVVEVYP